MLYQPIGKSSGHESEPRTLTDRYYSLFNNGNASAAPVFAQYLKSSKHPKYSVGQINVYPTGTYAIQVVVTLAYAWSSDSFLKGRRWPPLLVGAVSSPLQRRQNIVRANTKY